MSSYNTSASELVKTKNIALTWHNRATEKIKSRESFAGGDSILTSFTLPKLPPLSSFDGIEVVDCRVSGDIGPNSDLSSALLTVLRSGHNIGLSASIWVDIGFRAKGTRQSKKNCDQIGIFLSEGVWNFYWNYGSCFKVSPPQHREVVSHLLSATELPLTLAGNNEEFTINAADESQLKIVLSTKPGNNNPSWLMYKFENASAAEMVSRLRRALDSLEPQKILSAEWTAKAIPLDPRKSEISRSLYTQISQAPDDFPAQFYCLEGEFRLQNLSGLDSLRPLCGKDDRILTSLGYVRNFEGDAVNVEVETRADGHRLVLESKGTIDVYRFEEIFGVKFERDD